jgi:hypothetical protein
MLSAEARVGKARSRNSILACIFIILGTGFLFAQNPAATGDPYASRGERRSPNGKFEWKVRDLPTAHYELVNVATGKLIVAVDSYYPGSDESRYAHALGVHWNPESTVVALDELNRRRAGYLYFFVLRNGAARGFRAERIIPVPGTVDEGRLVVDSGWITPDRIRVRLTEKFLARSARERFYVIDFSDPDNPCAEEVH